MGHKNRHGQSLHKKHSFSRERSLVWRFAVTRRSATGNRVYQGREYPLFNELAIIQKSKFRTYTIKYLLENIEQCNVLEKLCEENGIEIEN